MTITPEDINAFITDETGTYFHKTHKERFRLLMARLCDQFNSMPEIKKEATIFNTFYHEVIIKELRGDLNEQ